MKKRMAILLSMLLAAQFAFAGTTAFAESEEMVESEETVESEEAADGVVELNWSDAEEQITEAGWEGDFVSFDEIAVKMWVPAVLQPVELTDEDVEGGYIGYFQTEDEAAAMSVMYVDVDGMELDEYKEQISELGASNITDVVLNGLEGVAYDIEENDTTSVAFATEAGYILEVTFSPESDEGFSALAGIISMSIQPEEAEEE